MTVPVLSLATLTNACNGSAVALRRRSRLQPAGGPGDKIFPPTYEGGTYARENRIIDGATVPCVLLDSVQSQANRMELALLQAHRARQIGIPVISVDFAAQGLLEVGTITSLEAPHRMADAILRDSLHGSVPFRQGPIGKVLDTASGTDATGLFGFCPTALVFGLWDSTGPRGGLGVKFQRALVGEVVAVNAEAGVKPSSRIDPLGIQLNAGPLYEAKDGGWTLDAKVARLDKGKSKLLGKEGKPSEANHGNVTPSLTNESGQSNHGGVTCAYTLQTTVLSLTALRRLHFPLSGKTSLATNAAAQTVLAALGLCGAVLAIEQGLDLRSRCLLVPEAGYPATWELVYGDGRIEPLALTGEHATVLLSEAVIAAKAAGLPWNDSDVTLTPSPGLVALVKKSRELALTASEAE